MTRRMARTPGILRSYQDQAEARAASSKKSGRNDPDPVADDLAKIYGETLVELQNKGT